MKSNNSIDKQLLLITKRLAKLEKMAALFEQHRQSWIKLGKGIKAMNADMRREARHRAKKDLMFTKVKWRSIVVVAVKNKIYCR